MPWISNTELTRLHKKIRDLEADKLEAVMLASALETQSMKPAPRDKAIIDAFRTLWPNHAAALRSLTKKRNPFADLFVGLSERRWESADIDTLLAMADAKRSQDRADETNADLAALRSGTEVEAGT